MCDHNHYDLHNFALMHRGEHFLQVKIADLSTGQGTFAFVLTVQGCGSRTFWKSVRLFSQHISLYNNQNEW